jgi:hypothetical protein
VGNEVTQHKIGTPKQAEGDTRLHGLPLALSHAVWGVFVATILITFVVVTVDKLSAPFTICDNANCTMSVADAAALRSVGLSPELGNFLTGLAFGIAMPVGFVVIAAVIVLRRSEDWMALLVSFSLIAFGPYLLGGVNLTLSTLPGWNLVSQLLLASGVLAFTSLFYLFPNGRFVPRSARYLFAAFGVAWLVGTSWNTSEILRGTYLGGEHSSLVDVVEIVLTLAMLVGGIAAQVYRYVRVSGAVERQQTKWVVVGLIGPILTLVLWLTVLSRLEAFSTSAGALFLLLLPLMALLALALPASVGISILRYRLFDIDLIIRRTLIYTLLTVILALFYFGSVVFLQQLFRATTGQGSEIAIIVSTLAIAALFNPLRRRIQEVIDRRFYRRKYDAATVLAAFGATARDEVDLQRLTQELVGVVSDIMQPEHVSMWLKQTEGSRLRREPSEGGNQ